MNRSKILELVDDGLLDSVDALTMCVNYMSNDEVGEILDLNELSERFAENEEY